MLLNIDLSDAKEMGTADALMELGRLAAPNQTKEYQKKRAEIQLDTYILPHLGSKPTSGRRRAHICSGWRRGLAGRVRVREGRRQGPLRQQEDKACGRPDGGAVQQRVQVLHKGHKVPRREDDGKGTQAQREDEHKPRHAHREDTCTRWEQDHGRPARPASRRCSTG